MASKNPSPKQQQQLQTQYGNYKNALQQLAQKIGDVEQEAEEHKSVPSLEIVVHSASPLSPTLFYARCFQTPAKECTFGVYFTASVYSFRFSPAITTRDLVRLVLETLGPLPGDRKCFRMINGVLVERTVRDVVPALETNAEGLKQVLDELVKQYKTKQDDLEKWKARTDSGIHVSRHGLIHVHEHGNEDVGVDVGIIAI
ncbi:putative Prefoldin subunit 2 [Seiridium unicorne]|uniref:Prefoldin subunit 2 n=1 Tax=Seiridium unicorne TaxID=138068 RepID=A0ABR2V2B0_9PEZI